MLPPKAAEAATVGAACLREHADDHSNAQSNNHRDISSPVDATAVQRRTEEVGHCEARSVQTRYPRDMIG